MFRRRDAQPDEVAAATGPTEPHPGELAAEPAVTKGRATPTRKQAEEQRRQRARPAMDRREEARRRRDEARRRRLEANQAMLTGDERLYAPRDKGPVRRFVRNYVDSRRTVVEFFLPILLVIFVASLIRSPAVANIVSLVWTLAMLLVIVDTTFLGVRLRRELRRRFPDDPGKGHVFYGIIRATQLRRFRLPRPQVRPGETV